MSDSDDMEEDTKAMLATLAILESPHLAQFLKNCESCSKDVEYELANVHESEDHGTFMLDCKNKALGLCQHEIPLWWHECKGCYVCTSCILLSPSKPWLQLLSRTKVQPPDENK